MSEEQPKNQEISKEQVIEAFRKFIELGINDPRELPKDSEVDAATTLFHIWINQIRSTAENDRNLLHLYTAMETTFFVDAGFRDPNYVKLVASWLTQDLNMAYAEDIDEETIEKIKAKLAELES